MKGEGGRMKGRGREGGREGGREREGGCVQSLIDLKPKQCYCVFTHPAASNHNNSQLYS